MFDDIREIILAQGVDNVALTEVDKIVFDAEFRKACEANSCGMYGKCWVCPPYVGDIHDLIKRAKEYKTAVVYQIIGQLEDSYDFEGMMETGARMNEITHKVHDEIKGKYSDALCLGSGGCKLCAKCAILEDKPCRFPESALASLESYGIAVSQLAEACGMKYINGANTVTYFGAILLK